MHDPTTANRQGPDVGSQYRSAIFYHNAQQEKEAKEVTEQVNKQWWNGKVATQVLPAGEWYDAETYHQLYLDKSMLAPISGNGRNVNVGNRPLRIRMPFAFPAQIP
jgi:methionine-S-sulfoxide reductase